MSRPELKQISNIVEAHADCRIYMGYDLSYCPDDRSIGISRAQCAFNIALDLVHELGHWIAATPHERGLHNWGLDEFYWWRNHERHDLREAQACYFQRLVVGENVALGGRFLSELSDNGRRYYGMTLSRYSAQRVERAAKIIPVGRLGQLWASLM